MLKERAAKGAPAAVPAAGKGAASGGGSSEAKSADPHPWLHMVTGAVAEAFRFARSRDGKTILRGVFGTMAGRLPSGPTTRSSRSTGRGRRDSLDSLTDQPPGDE
jgi:hypothetical protein